MEFETGAPNLTTAFDDVSFFVISSNLTIHLSLFLAVCGVTCFVCNFRNPCTVPSSCYPAHAAGRFGARESYYRLCVASTTSAAMRRAIETPRDTDQ